MNSGTDSITAKTVDLHLKILGRTLEHFGVQMYKQRPAAIAELVANCWDAGASEVDITIPEATDWSAPDAAIVIVDNGCGMDAETVQRAYLVLGRNRRDDSGSGTETPSGRKVMGRKGIGKLAGFGIADDMEVSTWRSGQGTRFSLKLGELLAPDAEVRDVPITGIRFEPKSGGAAAGTEVRLRQLRIKTPLDQKDLRKSLARRFSRTVQGQMRIRVNGCALPDPLEGHKCLLRFPQDWPDDMASATLPSGQEIRYGYAYTDKTIKETELAGFAIFVHGKTAQAPPFFFRVENTASGQHATKYISGVIEADFLDDGTGAGSDVISTDRQEIDWNHPACAELAVWGAQIARGCMSECTDLRGKRTAEKLSLDSSVAVRLKKLDSGSRRQAERLIGAISFTDSDDARALELVDSLLKVFEFRHFHDIVDDIERVADQPEILAARLDVVRDWKLLESRAIYEVIGGRLAMIAMFEKMLAKDAPETAHSVGQSNLHDAIGRFPWLLNPDYNIFAEEKSITTLLNELADGDVPKDERGRVDFCAITDDARVIVIELKRSSHAVTYAEIQRLQGYMEKIEASTNKKVRAMLIHGGSLNLTPGRLEALKKQDDIELVRWGSVLDSTKQRYKRYSAILEGEIEHPDASAAQAELGSIRGVVTAGSVYRTPDERRRGLGVQEP